MGLTTIVIIAVLFVVIVTVTIILVKSLVKPQKISSIQKLIKEQKYPQAQKLAKGIIAKNQRDYLAHYWLGKAYLADNKSELAFMEYKTVNENALFNGDIPEIEFRRIMAELYKKFNQPQDALKEYLLLTKLDPTNAENDYNVGQIYESMGKGAMAMGFYQKCITANKKHAKAHSAMGYLLYRSKQYTEAKKEIDTAIHLSPDTYSNYYYMGKILKDNNNFSAALKQFEKAERDPLFKQRALIERGSCYAAVTQFDNAITEYEHAIKISKDESNQETLYARYFLASCYEKTRNIEKAIEQWEKIFSRNRSFRDVATKLSQYKEIEANDNMKEYLTCSAQSFSELCKKIALSGFNLTCQRIEQTKSGCVMLASDDKKEGWMNQRQQMILVQFFRDTNPVEDSVVRKAADSVKSQNYEKAILISSSEFTRTAMSFAETRPINLVGKLQLETLLSKAGI